MLYVFECTVGLNFPHTSFQVSLIPLKRVSLLSAFLESEPLYKLLADWLIDVKPLWCECVCVCVKTNLFIYVKATERRWRGTHKKFCPPLLGEV